MKYNLFLALLATTMLWSCEDPVATPPTIESELTIGREHEGGLIAVIDPTGEHGLIIAAKDQSTRKVWEDAITLCNDLSLNGFDDWYLPSKDELAQIYAVRDSIGGISTAAPYWSSSERDEATAYCHSFTEGHQYYDSYTYRKSNAYRVRAVRKF